MSLLFIAIWQGTHKYKGHKVPQLLMTHEDGVDAFRVFVFELPISIEK